LFAAVSKRAGSAVLPATVVTQVLEDSLEGIFFFHPFDLKAVFCWIYFCNFVTLELLLYNIF
jgi:hypothetical protein